jgi:hypothetical protein
MYDFVYLSVRHSVRDSHWSRDYRDGTGIWVFLWKSGVLHASYVLITKSCGKNISEKYSLLELNKVTFNYRKHDKPNHILLIDI